jgi:pimeloyl-ACP methyl ester carboxylesterase
MPSFRSDDVEIAYETRGEGDPILLIHGFASNAQVNWFETGWVDALERDGRRVIAMDNRGHGASGKLYDPAAYAVPIMTEDARRLLDHLAIPRADILGYSMGARIAAFLTMNHPGRVRSAVIGGMAANMIHGVGGGEEIAEALEAPSADEVEDIVPLAFRLFAESTGSDLKALAACMRSVRQNISPAELGEIAVPVLVAAGSTDEVAGPVEPLVDAIPGARSLVIPGRDHMRTVGDRVFKQGVLAFLAERP